MHVSRFGGVEGLLNARLAAIEKVQTPWFFFLDDDDDLPEGIEGVLDECARADQALAYTNEVIREGGKDLLRQSAPYSQKAHLADFMLVHHLALCRTEDAKQAARTVPRGRYGFEPLFYWQLAKRGAAYVPRTGYIWNKGSGMHRRPDVRIGMVLSQVWAGRNA